jgi:anti-sigma factor RsiW
MRKDSDSRRDDLRCIEVVDMVTAFLDGEVSEDQRRRIDHHLEGCQGCQRRPFTSSGRSSASPVA